MIFQRGTGLLWFGRLAGPAGETSYPAYIAGSGGYGTTGDPGKEFQLSGKIGVSFSLCGDLRFLSHQDMLCLFSRAIRRAGLPIVYSQGYNPRPRLWLMLPKPLGVSCVDDLLVIELSDNCTAEAFAERLAQDLPAGIRLQRCFKLAPGRTPQPSSAAYTLALSGEDAAKVATKIPALLDSARLPVQRLCKRNAQFQEVNIRPYLSRMGLALGELSFCLICSPAGSAKPAEVLAMLDLDNPPNRAKLVRAKTIYAGLLAEGSGEENN